MKSFLLAVAITASITSQSFAQQSSKSIYAELGGPGLASVNFDMRFSKAENGIGGRIGLGGFAVDGSSLIFIPLGINYLIGKETSHYFELGAGATVTVISEDLLGEDRPFTGTFGHLLFGYRYQPQKEGITFRAFINPIFGNGLFWPYYAGLSFGYKF